jgi:hypothetical protein
MKLTAFLPPLNDTLFKNAGRSKAREYRHLMTDATKSEEMRRLGGTAVDYAKRAVCRDALY